MLLLDVDTLAIVLELGHPVDHLGEGFQDDALVVVDGLELSGVGVEIVGLDGTFVDQWPDHASRNTPHHGLWLKQVPETEGIQACCTVDYELREKIYACNLDVEPGRRQVAFGLSYIRPVLK